MIMSFPNKLKQCRTQKKMTQQNIADILNVSRKTVSGWENGRSYPDVNLLISISDIFHISVDDLIRDDRILSYYAEKERQNNKASLVSHITYILNFFLLGASYLHIFFIPGFRSSIISILLIVNAIISLSLFDNWSKFKRKITLFKLFGGFISVFMMNIFLNFFNVAFLNNFLDGDASTLIGISIGRILLDLFVTTSIIIVIFFSPFSKVEK